jgi:hypothetical protein
MGQARPVNTEHDAKRNEENGMSESKPSLKARALHEFARFATMFAYQELQRAR